MCGWCVDDLYGICVCMMCVYTLQGTHAKFRKRTSWCQFFPSMWVLKFELGFLGKGFTCIAAFLWPSLCKDSELCPDEGITSFLFFFIILVKLDRHIPCGKDGIILADISLLPNGIFFLSTWFCQCCINTERPYSVSGKDMQASVWFLLKLQVFCLNRKLETLQLGSSVLPLSILLLILWIPEKLKASDPLPVHLRVSLQSLVSGNVRAFPFRNQSKGISEEGPSGPVKWPLSGSLWKSIA